MSLINRLIETDHGGRIVYATPEAGAIVGVSPRELVGRDVLTLFPGFERQLRSHLRAVLVMPRPREPVAVTLARPLNLSLDLNVTATRLDSRRVQWRILRADER